MIWGVLKSVMQGLDIVLDSGHSNAMEIKIYDSGIFYGRASLAESTKGTFVPMFRSSPLVDLLLVYFGPEFSTNIG